MLAITGDKPEGCVFWAENKREYERMSAPMVGLPDETLKITFVKGMKLEIRAKVSTKAHWVGPINGNNPIA